MGRSKYPSLGILDALYELSFGVSSKPPKPVTRAQLHKKILSQGMSPRLFSKRISLLKTKKYIDMFEHDELVLTPLGKELVSGSLSHIVFKNKKTDGYQRLIIFDIPETHRHARDIFRRKLKEFECQQLQKSVYVTPYVCEKEIREVARILKIEKHVNVLKVVTL